MRDYAGAFAVTTGGAVDGTCGRVQACERRLFGADAEVARRSAGRSVRRMDASQHVRRGCGVTRATRTSTTRRWCARNIAAFAPRPAIRRARTIRSRPTFSACSAHAMPAWRSRRTTRCCRRPPSPGFYLAHPACALLRRRQDRAGPARRLRGAQRCRPRRRRDGCSARTLVPC